MQILTNAEQVGLVIAVIERLRKNGNDCHSADYTMSGLPIDDMQIMTNIHVEVSPDYADYMDAPLDFDYEPLHGLFLACVDDDTSRPIPICANRPIEEIVSQIEDAISDFCWA